MTSDDEPDESLDSLRATDLMLRSRAEAESHDETVGQLRRRCDELAARVAALEAAAQVRASIIADQVVRIQQAEAAAAGAQRALDAARAGVSQ